MYSGWKKDAWNSLRAQRHRCNNSNASDYKYYGGRGIKALCTTKEFFIWWDISRKEYGSGVKLSVDRLDHNKDYTMDNIQLIPHRENVIESNIRRAQTYLVFDKEDNFLREMTRRELKELGIASSTVSYLEKTAKYSGKWGIGIKLKR